MNDLSGFLLDRGVRVLIGKGGMGEMVREQTERKRRLPCIHRRLRSPRRFTYEMQGPLLCRVGMAEAVWELEFDNLPLVVGIDSMGNDIFHDVSGKAKLQFNSLFK